MNRPSVVALAAVALSLWLAASAGAAYTGTVAGNAVTLTGDATGDSLTIRATGAGTLRHDPLAGFNSDADFDSGTAGDQTVANSAAVTLTITAGGGLDFVDVGAALDVLPKVVADGGGQGDTLLVFTPQTSLTLGSNKVTRLVGGEWEYAGFGSISVGTSSADDTVALTSSTAGPVTLRTADGNDTLILANGASLGGKFAGGRGSDTIDYSAWTTPLDVNLGKEATFMADLTGAQQVPPSPSTATGFGSVLFSNLDAGSSFLYHLETTGLTAAQITDSHIHNAAAGINGPVVFPIGAGGTWTNTATPPSTDGGPTTDADITEPLLRDGSRYYNIHTSNPLCPPPTPCSGGEIRGQLGLDPEEGYGGPATGIPFDLTGVENVIGGSGADVLKGSPDVNRIVGGPGADELVAKDGNDTIIAADGVADVSVNCGADNDLETSDPGDAVTNCEKPVGPAVTGTDPAGPADNQSPRVKGTATAGTTVKIYGDGACTSTSLLSSGPAADFAGAGILTPVANGSLTTFFATLVDQVGESACSATSASYQEVAVAPPPPPGPPPPPPPPPGPPPPPPPAPVTPIGSISAITPKAKGSGSQITIATGSTATCPAGATADCALTATVTALIPARALGKKGKPIKTTLGKLATKLKPGTARKITFKLSRKLTNAWRAAKRLKLTFANKLTVPGGTPATRSRTLTLKAPKAK